MTDLFTEKVVPGVLGHIPDARPNLLARFQKNLKRLRENREYRWEFLRKAARRLLLLLQFAATVIFGVWAPKAWTLAEKANQLSYTANQLSEKANSFAHYAYQAQLVEIRLAIMALCAESQVCAIPAVSVTLLGPRCLCRVTDGIDPKTGVC